MEKFIVRYITKEGHELEESREATDKFLLYKEFKDKGEHVLEIKEASKAFDLNNLMLKFNTVGVEDKINFLQNLGSMIQAGLSISRALFVLERQNKNIKIKSVINQLNTSIKSGKSLSTAMKEQEDVFSELVISMISVGEESGGISESLKSMANQLEKTHKLVKKIRGAMIYPGIILSIMLSISVLMMIFVVPSISKTFKDLKMELPFVTQTIIDTSDLFVNYGYFVFIGFLILIFVLYLLYRNPRVKRVLEWVVLRMPLFGELVRQSNIARILRTLYMLIKGGVSVPRSFAITKGTITNSYYQEIVEECIGEVEKGSPISKVFEKYPFLVPSFVVEMTSVGEETSEVSQMFLGVAEYFEENIDNKTKDLSTIIEPILMVVIGLGVGFFALSIVQPLYGLVDAI